MEFDGHDNSILKFIVAGEFIFSLAEHGEFIVFNRKTGEVQKKIKFDKNFNNFIHPSTYVNKLLFSSGDSLQLWNVISENLIFDFGKQGVTCIEQSPVVDIIALGFENGEIKLVNLLYNEEILKFDARDPVQCLSFSSDTSMEYSILASLVNGQVTLWDLNSKKIHATMSSNYQLSCLKFMPNEPILVTTSEKGNFIKMWFFEKGQVQPRLLR